MEDEYTNLDQEVNEAESESEDDYGFEFDDSDDFDTDDDLTGSEDGAQEETFTVKYNGEEKQLSREELITAAQKGLNYDKVKSKLDSFESGNVYKAMKAGADKAGMTMDAYAAYLLENSEADAQLDAETEIRNKYPGAPADMIKELASLRRKEAGGKQQSSEQSAEQKAWAQVLQEYPDLKIDQIPEDVQEDVKNGVSPLLAMKNHEIRELKQQKKAEAVREKNEKNKKASVGSVTGSYGDGKKDPFLEGYE